MKNNNRGNDTGKNNPNEKGDRGNMPRNDQNGDGKGRSDQKKAGEFEYDATHKGSKEKSNQDQRRDEGDKSPRAPSK